MTIMRSAGPLSLAVLGLLASSLTGLTASAAAAGPRVCRSWSGGQPPNRGEPSDSNVLSSVAVSAGCGAWAVGYYSTGAAYQTLIEHRDGKAWKIVPSQDPQEFPYLTGVTAISARDAWAVGSYSPPKSDVETLIEHWNGTAWHVDEANGATAPLAFALGVNHR